MKESLTQASWNTLYFVTLWVIGPASYWSSVSHHPNFPPGIGGHGPCPLWLRHCWQDMETNSEILKRAGICNTYALFSQRRLRWQWHARRMDSVRIPKDLPHRELAAGVRPMGRPYLHFKDICERDTKLADVDINTWERLPDDRTGPPWCGLACGRPRRWLPGRKSQAEGENYHSSRAFLFSLLPLWTRLPFQNKITISHSKMYVMTDFSGARPISQMHVLLCTTVR